MSSSLTSECRIGENKHIRGKIKRKVSKAYSTESLFLFFIFICYCCSQAEKLSQSLTDIKEFIAFLCDVHYHSIFK